MQDDPAPPSWSGELAATAVDVVAAAAELGDSRCASVVRAWSVPFLFANMEAAFKGSEDPQIALRQVLGRLAAYFRATASSGVTAISGNASVRDAGVPVERMTGEHYGRLFREFDVESFASEPKRLLSERLHRNEVSLPELARSRVLDAGCGGGRYSVAWHLLGARDVLGVDLSEPGLADARARVEQMKIDSVRFQQLDVVELPLEDSSFDVVFSNGVLHHTRDWRTGLHNLVRVLRPGGVGWLYLIENPGGLFWDVIELCRQVMKGEVHEFARIALAALGIPANRIFYMLDHVMVPINIRLTAEQISTVLTASGAREIRRLERGADFDRVERIYQKDPFATVKYGAGEHRFVFSK